jgi:uncharacterized membrane-anchored protein YhcB (DUF1043 family)
MSEETTQETTNNSPLDAVQQEINKLKADLDENKSRLQYAYNEKIEIKTTVHKFFDDMFSGGETEATISRDEANELLGNIAANLLEMEYEGRVVISYTFTVKAEDEDDARSKVESAVGGMEYNFDAGADDSYAEESIEVEF